MKSLLAVSLLYTACAVSIHAQGRPLDWPFLGGDAQRSGWEKSDLRITRENAKDIRLVLKRKFPNTKPGPKSITPPVVIGNLISYRGFKELAFVATNADELWSIDADLDRVFWQKKLGSNGGKKGSAACSAMVAAVPALTPPTNFAARPRPAPAPARSPGPPPSPAATPVTASPSLGPGRALLGSTGFGAPRPAFALSSDGKLHALNTSTGDDVVPPLPFLPANAKATALTISEGVLFTTTSSECGDAPDAVWAMDLNTPEHQVRSFKTNGEAIGGAAGLAFGSDGTVYVQTAKRLLALSHNSLEEQGTFAAAAAGVTPLVFSRDDHDFVITATADGRLVLLDSKALSTPVAQTEPVDGTVWGGLASWQDADGVRWVLAPVWGKSSGSVMAFKVDDTNGKPSLVKGWVSEEMRSPEPPVITAGVVFVLAAGGPSPATLYALDGLTGKQLYSTGAQVTAPGNLNGLSIANGRVYFGTTDGTLWAFGIYLEL